MRTLRVIGIGPGDPRQITIQAIDAMQDVEAFLVLDKSASRGNAAVRQSLVGLRREICDRYIRSGTARFVEIDDPPREHNPVDYEAEVRRWHSARTTRIEEALRAEVRMRSSVLYRSFLRRALSRHTWSYTQLWK